MYEQRPFELSILPWPRGRSSGTPLQNVWQTHKEHVCNIWCFYPACHDFFFKPPDYCNYHQHMYVTVDKLCILMHSYKHMCRMWCKCILTRWHPRRRLGAQLFLQPHLMTSWHALDAYERTVHLGFHSHVGTHGLSHLDKLLVWYTLRVILFVGGKFSCGNVHFRVNSSFRTPLVLTSLYLALLFCHIKHGTSFSDSIILYFNCISVDWQFIEWLCYLRIHSFVLALSCKDRHRIASCECMKHRKRSWFC